MNTVLVFHVAHHDSACALAALDRVTKRATAGTESCGASDATCEPELQQVQSTDPFNGGGRSKGEKKRAAHERRLKGGY